MVAAGGLSTTTGTKQMKTKTMLAALLLAAVIVTPSYGDNVEEPEVSPLKVSLQGTWQDKSFKEKLQGSWSRTDH